jgi:serine O-acetyltransferase
VADFDRGERTAQARGDKAIPLPATTGDSTRSRPTTVRYSLVQTLRLIRSDLAHNQARKLKKPGLIGTLRLLVSSPMACVIRYRLQCLLYSNRLGPLGSVLKFLNLLLYGIEIDERARIGGGFVIGHPRAILITADVTIGERCVIYHQTMVGKSPYFEPGKDSGPVTVGNDVVFAMGSCAYGEITIGDGCRVSANSVVDQSAPPCSVLLGVPARIVGNTMDKREDG